MANAKQNDLSQEKVYRNILKSRSMSPSKKSALD